MRAILIKYNADTNSNELSEEVITDYKSYYPLIDEGTFDVVMVQWNKQDISIYLDDEGLMKSDNYGRILAGYPEPLFGNLVICGGVDAEGNTLDLPEEFNIDNIKPFIGTAVYKTK